MKFVMFWVLTGFVNGLSFSSQGVAFPLPFGSHQEATRFTYKHKPSNLITLIFKLVSRMLTSVEEDRLFYFSLGIYGTKLRQDFKVLNLWYAARENSAFECVDASEILASGGDISF
ncbi:hypothetical protein YC2023_103013 [Brassica napus]